MMPLDEWLPPGKRVTNRMVFLESIAPVWICSMVSQWTSKHVYTRFS